MAGEGGVGYDSEGEDAAALKVPEAKGTMDMKNDVEPDASFSVEDSDGTVRHFNIPKTLNRRQKDAAEIRRDAKVMQSVHNDDRFKANTSWGRTRFVRIAQQAVSLLACGNDIPCLLLTTFSKKAKKVKISATMLLWMAPIARSLRVSAVHTVRQHLQTAM